MVYAKLKRIKTVWYSLAGNVHEMVSTVSASVMPGVVHTYLFLFVSLGCLGIIAALWLGRTAYMRYMAPEKETPQERQRIYNPHSAYGAELGSGDYDLGELVLDPNLPGKEGRVAIA